MTRFVAAIDQGTTSSRCIIFDAAGRTVGKDIYLVGVDALPEVVQLVMEGRITGTVLNDHIGQSHTAGDVAIKAAAGEPLENNYTVDYVKVTQENAA